MNAKALKRLRRAAFLVRERMLMRASVDPTISALRQAGVISSPPTQRQVYRRLKARESTR